ncbi:BTAD domain-containing putative transcriptional regulator [Kitasatospora sp. YST-16]|uniref:ATP-binding protein n=1 Tax=Kitasatospora sp. YST-16 TaxID=2998080 RepID=UPI0022834F25|nr:BTAD domain-containing putative transcriptional regulator [Kitasatospora sp. YST-16]WAL71551.1 BTAD domain-containing putative transcriptional regulator [Kitasatospora sp. YST-16]WNW37591.1 BTAD domain-containing putative transcriptional regulator [Streptomyces sp. Li-HN-5-13]
MHYGILGTTTAHHDDGTPVALGGARLRALLAALALRQGRPVPAELLADEVWADEPPQDAAAALQTLVGRLRRTVGRAEIGSGPAGYWLTDPRTDVAEFQRRSADGARALQGGDPAAAAEQLTAALALWRGPALADLPDRTAPAARLESQRAEARRHRLTADLALGRTAEVTAELAELCRDHPFDEQLQALQLRALRAAGRTAEALGRYEEVRRTLAEELGTDPGPELRALHRELLTADAPPAPAPAPAPAPPAAAPATGNLRPGRTSFVGRDGELATVADALTAGRLTTLTGPGGSGKTRLSVEAGRIEQDAARWPGGVWQIELAPLEDPAAVPDAVASALGLRETVLHTGGAVAEAIEGGRKDPVSRLVDHLGRRRVLLLLDNCEHVVQAAADLADRLLADCPGVTVLATSREPLGVPGESVLPVEPLPDPSALRLLAERGAAARPGFRTDQDPAACAELCRRLDGLPLAIELAAARLRGLTPRQLADRLDSRFALLTAGSRTLLPRQQTLRAVVDWSWDLLGKRERAVLRRLSVFAGGCTLEAAEQVVADGALVRREEVADLLLSLVDKSLLVAGLGEQPRYWMLETIHEYAAERLAEAAEPDTADRHTRHYRELARTAHLNLHGPGQLDELARLDREQENLRAALRRAVDTGQEQEGLALALAMAGYWMLRDYRTESRTWYEAVSALGPDPYADGAPPPVPLTANPLDAPLPMPPDLLDEARRQLGLLRLISLFSGDMSMLHSSGALDTAERILAAYTPDLPQSYRQPVLARIFTVFLTGEMERTREVMDDAVAGARVHGDPLDLAFALQLRARLLNDLAGGLDQAIADSEEALALYTAQGDRWGMSDALSGKAENATKSGDAAEAEAAFRQAIELSTQLGAHQEVPMLRARLGEVLAERDPEAGERMVREAVADASGEHTDAEGARMYGRLVLCNLAVRRGEYAEALAVLDELPADPGARGPVPSVFAGIVGCIRGWVVARSGDPAAGLELMRAGRRTMTEVEGGPTIFVEHMAMMLMTPLAGALVEYARAYGEPAAARRAAALLGAHEGISGMPGSFMERSEHARCAAAARELLGADAYLAAYEEGGRLTLREASALLNDPGPFRAGGA